MTYDREQQLKEAYRTTQFMANTPTHTICIRIGEKHDELDSLLEDHGDDEWAYITAWNPGPKRLSEQENQQRQAQLEADLRSSGLTLYSGDGVAADGSHREASVLIIGLSKEDAIEAGRKWDQSAIVYGQRGEAAQLLYCRQDE